MLATATCLATLVSATTEPIIRKDFRPRPATVDLVRGTVVRCLHRESRSNAYFKFKREEDEAAAYNVSTPTEADAVDVTGKVTGYNVELLETIAKVGGWTVEFYVMCGQGSPCDQSTHYPPGTSALPSDDNEMIEYFAKNMTTFDCIVTSESTAHGVGILEYARYMSTPTLQTGYQAYAKVLKAVDSTEVWSSRNLLSWRAPFSNQTWFLLAFCFVFGGAIYGGLISSRPDGGFGDGVYRATALYTGASGPDPTTAPGKIFTVFFSFFTLLMVSAYTANLTTYLTVNQIVRQPIESIQDFGANGHSVCALGATTIGFLERHYPSTRVVDVKRLPTYDPNVELYAQVFQAVRDGYCYGLVMKNNYASNLYITDSRTMENFAGDRYCDFEPIGPEEGIIYYMIPWHWRVASTAIFSAHDYVMMLLLEDGTLTSIKNNYFPSSPHLAGGCGGKSGEDDVDEHVQYDLDNTAGYFLIAAAAVCLGLAGVLAEKAFKKVVRGESWIGAVAEEDAEAPAAAQSDADAELKADLRAVLERLEAEDARRGARHRSRSPHHGSHGAARRAKEEVTLAEASPERDELTASTCHATCFEMEQPKARAAAVQY